MFCGNCGTKNDDNSNFCNSCGASLKVEESVTNTNDFQSRGNFQSNTGYSNNGWSQQSKLFGANRFLTISFFASIANLVCLFAFEFIEISRSGMTDASGAITLLQIVDGYKFAYILFLIPIISLLIIVFAPHIGKKELLLPIVGFILNISLLVYLYITYNTIMEENSWYGIVDTIEIYGRAGFYLSQLCYVIHFIDIIYRRKKRVHV